MRNTIKILAIIALAVIIGISFAACGGDGNNEKEKKDNGEDNGEDTPVAVTGVTLDKSSISLIVGVKETETLTATVAPADATNKAVTWSSSDPSKVTVADGVVTAVALGPATITVTTADGGKTASCSVTVVRLVEMVLIPAGTFTMGQTGIDEATPVHSVTLSGFYMGKYEVTQEQWQAVMVSNPSNFNGSDGKEPANGEVQSKRPVENVSWYDALVFCNKLSMMEGLSPAYSISNSTNPDDWGSVPTTSYSTWDTVEIVGGSTGYRLPTEAQWEYACRAGTTTVYNTGNTISDNTGWYSINSGSKTHQVGLKPANAWELYDMHGNVWEWCWDWNGSYSSEAQTNPLGASSGSFRVTRGGSYNYSDFYQRSAYRVYEIPNSKYNDLGFRLVRSSN